MLRVCVAGKLGGARQSGVFRPAADAEIAGVNCDGSELADWEALASVAAPAIHHTFQNHERCHKTETLLKTTGFSPQSFAHQKPNPILLDSSIVCF